MSATIEITRKSPDPKCWTLEELTEALAERETGSATRLLERARAALALGCGSHLKDCDCEACTTLEAIVDWLWATHG